MVSKNRVLPQQFQKSLAPILLTQALHKNPSACKHFSAELIILHTPFSTKKIHQEPRHVKTSSLDILKLFVLASDFSDWFLQSLYTGRSSLQVFFLMAVATFYTLFHHILFKVKRHLSVTLGLQDFFLLSSDNMTKRYYSPY